MHSKFLLSKENSILYTSMYRFKDIAVLNTQSVCFSSTCKVLFSAIMCVFQHAIVLLFHTGEKITYGDSSLHFESFFTCQSLSRNR